MRFKVADWLEIAGANTLLGIVGVVDKAGDLLLTGLFTIGVQVCLKWIEKRYFSKNP